MNVVKSNRSEEKKEERKDDGQPSKRNSLNKTILSLDEEEVDSSEINSVSASRHGSLVFDKKSPNYKPLNV